MKCWNVKKVKCSDVILSSPILFLPPSPPPTLGYLFVVDGDFSTKNPVFTPTVLLLISILFCLYKTLSHLSFPCFILSVYFSIKYFFCYTLYQSLPYTFLPVFYLFLAVFYLFLSVFYLLPIFHRIIREEPLEVLGNQVSFYPLVTTLIPEIHQLRFEGHVTADLTNCVSLCHVVICGSEWILY